MENCPKIPTQEISKHPLWSVILPPKVFSLRE